MNSAAITSTNTSSANYDNQNYEEGVRQANEALRDLMELVNTPGFEDHDGWKQKISNKNDVVYSKRYKMGKVFTMRTNFNFPLQQAFVEHWENFVDITQHNKNISSVKIVADLSSNTDIVYYAMNDISSIKGREFLMCRTFRRADNEIIEAARSFDLPGFEYNPQKIRGHIVLGGGRFRIHPKDSTKTIVDYVMCVDFKSPDIPKTIMDATLSMLIIQDAESIRKQIEKLKREAV
uniref:START domain-containing protein n=1 Tax=Elaeophora elaphi TaxID=1147741 RepID=A0A0R3S3H3_9BILA